MDIIVHSMMLLKQEDKNHKQKGTTMKPKEPRQAAIARDEYVIANGLNHTLNFREV